MIWIEAGPGTGYIIMLGDEPKKYLSTKLTKNSQLLIKMWKFTLLLWTLEVYYAGWNQKWIYVKNWKYHWCPFSFLKFWEPNYILGSILR